VNLQPRRATTAHRDSKIGGWLKLSREKHLSCLQLLFSPRLHAKMAPVCLFLSFAISESMSTLLQFSYSRLSTAIASPYLNGVPFKFQVPIWRESLLASQDA
jgi:hypothetical protein